MNSLLKQIISILIFSDNIMVSTIVNSDLSSFKDDIDGLTVIRILSEYYKKFGKTPKELHAKELLDSLYLDEYKDIFDSLNENFVLQKLINQINYNSYTVGVLNALRILQKGPEFIEEIAHAVQVLDRKNITVFNSTNVDRNSCREALIHNSSKELLYSGVQALDEISFVPEKGTLGCFLGKPKTGKSLYLMQMTWANVQKGKKVLLITLEVSTKIILQRLCRLVLNAHDRDTPYEVFSLENLKKISITPKKLLRDIQESDLEIMDSFSSLLHIVERPQRSFTLEEFDLLLNSSINNGFHPDLVLIDYVAIMGYDSKKQYYEVLPPLFGKLRGLATKYNVAIETVHQPSVDSDGDDTKLLKSSNISLAKGLVSEVDRFATWTISPSERLIGIGRIYPEMNRNGHCGDKIFLNQIDFRTNMFSIYSCVFTTSLSKQIFGK